MNWIFCIILFVSGIIIRDVELLWIASIFGIGSSIEVLATNIKNSNKN